MTLPHLTEEERSMFDAATRRGAWEFAPEVAALCLRLSLARAVVEAARELHVVRHVVGNCDFCDALSAHDAGMKS